MIFFATALFLTIYITFRQFWQISLSSLRAQNNKGDIYREHPIFCQNWQNLAFLPAILATLAGFFTHKTALLLMLATLAILAGFL